MNENKRDEETEKLINELVEKMIGSNYLDEDSDIDYGNTSNEFKIELKYINESDNEDPRYMNEGDSGFDLRANNNEVITIPAGQSKMIPTGLKFELPFGYELQVRSRSGLAAKKNVFVLNSPGTVDFKYIEEVKVILTNLGENDFEVRKGDRIAQGVLAPVAGEHLVLLNKTNEFSRTEERGGFGSTGVS